MDAKNPSWKVPGIFLLTGTEKNIPNAEQFGPFQVWANGRLTSVAANQSWSVFFEGILFRDYKSGKSDAEIVLEEFSKSENARDVYRLKGFYNLIIIQNDGKKGFLISDKLCSRPQYLYSSGNNIGTAPTPLSFADANYPISLDESALYEMVMFLQNGYNRTLTNEIKRLLPGHIYEFDDHENLHEIQVLNFTQDINYDLSADVYADWMYNICKEPMEAIFSHPELKNLDVHMPLTSGLDSRHILGQLLELKRKPAALRHIRLTSSDFNPVKKISDALKIPLIAPSIYDLNVRNLFVRWAERSGGLVNFHQFYLLQLKDQLPDQGAIEFNGYLMDKFLGVAPVTKYKPNKEVLDSSWGRTYTSHTILKLLFPDAKKHRKNIRSFYREWLSQFNGEQWFQMGLHEFFRRGIQYTGITDTMISDDGFSFSPGASSDSLSFFSQVPFSIGGKKKTRLRALNKYFPEVAAFPDADGIPFNSKEERPRTSPSAFSKNAPPFLKYIFSGFNGDPAPETEHAWLRQNNQLHDMHKKIVFEGDLVKDGIIPSHAIKTIWYLHKSGGFQAWTLMSLLSAEVAYQLLSKQHSLSSVTEWLTESSD
jgi:hypothetical protein